MSATIENVDKRALGRKNVRSNGLQCTFFGGYMVIKIIVNPKQEW